MPEDSNNKYYRLAKENQKKFQKSEKDLDKKYKEILEKEREFDYLNRLHPEDSTAEPEFANGGLVGRGQGKAIKIKKTKIL